MIHIWHEDSSNSATTQFWNFLKLYKVNKNLINADIRGFNGNNKLKDFVCSTKYNRGDIYYIFIDKVLDNTRAIMYYEEIAEFAKDKPYIIVSDLLSFEYMILSFKYFINWTEKQDKGYKLLEKIRQEFISIVKEDRPWTESELLIEFVARWKRIDKTKANWEDKLKYVSTEQIATQILSLMTNGGAKDFGVSKTRLGECWTCNCCYRNKHKEEKNCKNYKYRRSSIEKAKNLYNNTEASRYIK